MLAFIGIALIIFGLVCHPIMFMLIVTITLAIWAFGFWLGLAAVMGAILLIGFAGRNSPPYHPW